MSWQAVIAAGGPTWQAVGEYADERVVELTAICVRPESSDAEIRTAQSGIAEMLLLQSLPERLKASAEMSKTKTRREY